ncbi:LytTR family DNA-binding domain-containing protein [Algirhabdus cladophorae]|uniref:LytTR family DNA-binding domain-containing protein n=1 Tax=Algirhabdus cladophorae TaxID=3377108 RepID=UPI003B84953D
MTNAKAQLALREWGAHIAHPVRAMSLGAVAVVLTLLGPFDTDVTLHLVPRFCYWTLLTVFGYSGGYVADLIASALFAAPSKPLLRTAVAGIITGILVLGLVILLHIGFFGSLPNARILTFIAANVFVISIVISTVLQFAFAQRDSADLPTGPATVDSTPPILKRLEFAKRGGLIALSVEDHYVRVYTTQGQDMILMRLGDAMRETAPARGLQVHRSHWIALDRVVDVQKYKDRATVLLSNQVEIPVSRTYVPQLKEAGLLP